MAQQAAARLRAQHATLLSTINDISIDLRRPTDHAVVDALIKRSDAIRDLVVRSTDDTSATFQRAVQLVAEWIDEKALVRITGFGEGRPATAIPAHRLAQMGARIHVDSATLPRPDPLRGGGMIVVFDIDTIPAVTECLIGVRRTNRDLDILGIGPVTATAIGANCDVYVAVPASPADGPYEDRTIDGHVLAQILDTLIHHASHLLGHSYTNSRIRETRTTWRSSTTRNTAP